MTQPALQSTFGQPGLAEALRHLIGPRGYGPHCRPGEVALDCKVGLCRQKRRCRQPGRFQIANPRRPGGHHSIRPGYVRVLE